MDRTRVNTNRALHRKTKLQDENHWNCGTTSNEEISWLNGKDVETIILDHHEASPLGAPDCCALVNPKATRDLSDYNYDYFCSFSKGLNHQFLYFILLFMRQEKKVHLLTLENKFNEILEPT